MRAVNLLPDRRRLGASIRHRTLLICGGGPVFLLANLIGWLAGSSLLAEDLGAGYTEIASIRQQIEQTKSEQVALKATLTKLSSERSAREALAARPVWAALLKRIALVSIDHGKLDRITVNPLGAERGKASTPTAEAGMIGFAVKLAGQATDAAALTRLLLRLEEIGIFDKVTLLSSSRVREDINDASVRFEIRCTIVGGGS